MKKNRLVSAITAALTIAAGLTAAPAVTTPAAAAVTVGPAWTCPSNFLQTGANVFYSFSAATNPGQYTLLHTMGTTEIASGTLNGIGYNPADNYIYGTAGTNSIYKVGTDGVASLQFTATGGTVQSTGGDFLAPNLLLNAAGANWSITNVSQTATVGGIAPKTAVAFSGGSTSWLPYDFVVLPGATANTWRVFGLHTNGTAITLQTAVVTFNGTTYSVVVNAAAAVTTATGSAAPTSGDSFGAQYSDVSGDLYAWGNSTKKMYRIPKAQLDAFVASSTTPTATQVAVGTTTTPSSPNDGASCKGAASPTATSPTASNLDAYGVAGTTLTVDATHKTGNFTPIYQSGQYANTHWVNTVTNGSATQTAAATSPYAITGSALTVGGGTFNLADAANGYYSYSQAAAGSNSVAFTINGTSAASVSNSANLTLHMLGFSGSVPGSMTNGSAITPTTFTVPTGAGIGSYSWSLSGCPAGLSIDANGQLTGTPTGGSGTVACTVTVTDAGTGLSYSQTFNIAFAAPAVLTFDANGGSGAPAAINFNSGTTVGIPASNANPTRTGYTFAGWNTVKAGGGTQYAAGATTGVLSASLTLYAQWTANSYTITYSTDARGTVTGTAPPVQTFVYGTSATIVAPSASNGNLDRAGFTFGGWNTVAGTAVNGSTPEANGNGVSYIAGNTYGTAADLVLYPVWYANQAKTVTYLSNGATGGSVPLAQTSTSASFTILGLSQCGTAANTACSLVRAGYTFEGWNTAANGTGTNYIAGDVYPYASPSLTLYARWTAINYYLDFDLNGGSGTAPSHIGFTAATPPTIPTTSITRLGYTFGYWSTAANGSGGAYYSGDTYSLLQSAVMYAIWIPNSYSVTYLANGGSTIGLPGVQSFTFGNPATLSTATLSRTGYKFEGWNTAADKTGLTYLGGDTYGAATNLTLYAVWSAVEYAVVYEKNGATGTPPTRQVFTVLAPAHLASNITPLGATRMTFAGYSFSGWNTAADGSGTSYAAGTTYGEPVDETLYAQWTPITYTLVYHATNANNASSVPVSQRYTVRDAAAVAALVLTRAGYRQTGWNTLANGTGENFAVNDAFNLVGGGDLYPIWTVAGNYSVIYDLNGGSGTTPTTVSSGTNVATTIVGSAGFSYPGYTFGGWNTLPNPDPASTDPAVTGTPYAASASYTGGADTTLNLFAVWTPVTYTLKYNLNGGTGSTPVDQTFDVRAGTVIASMSSAPTKAGYSFDGWWSNSPTGNGTIVLSAGDVYSQPADITIYAMWIPNNYTVSYDLNGGSGTAPTSQVFTVATGTTIANAVGNISRPGYTFDGWWNTAANGGGTGNYVGGDHYNSPADLTLYAVWKAITYSVIYEKLGGTSTTIPAKVDFTMDGSAVTIQGNATDPTKTGYTFMGWNTAANGTGLDYVQNDTYKSPADITLFAQWEANNYSVVYDTNGATSGVAPATQTFTVEAPATIQGVADPANPLVKPGFNFIGWWNTAANGQGGQTYASGDVYGDPADLTLYALWEAVGNSEVIYDENGGTGTIPAPQSVVTGGSVTVSSLTGGCSSANCTLHRDGYTFGGWNTQADGHGTAVTPGSGFTVSANTKLYAVWTLVTYHVTFDCNYGSCPTTGSAAVPAALTTTVANPATIPAAVPTRAGYTFVEWNISSSAANSGNAYQPGDRYTDAADATLYAIWDANKYQVFYDGNGASGGSIAPATFAFGTTLSLANAAAAAAASMAFNGATLVSWNTNADGTGTSYALGAGYSDAADLTLFAIWNFHVTYDINFPSGSTNQVGTAPATQDYRAGSSGVTIVAPGATPTATSSPQKIFRGWWSTVNNEVYAPGDIYALLANLNLQGVWVDAGNKTLTYDVNGGTGPVPTYQSYATGSVTVSTPDLLMMRDGYTFAGWNTQADGRGTSYAAGASFSATTDTILYAVWTPVQLVLSYDVNGKTATAPAAQVFSTVAAATVTPTAPSSTNYDFVGWNTQPDGTGTSYTANQTVSSTTDIILFAMWVVHPQPATPTTTTGGGVSGTTTGVTPVTLNPTTPADTKSLCLVDPVDQVCKQTVIVPGIGTWVLSGGNVTFTAVSGWVGTTTVVLRATLNGGNIVETPLSVTVVAPKAPSADGASASTITTSPVSLTPYTIGDGKVCIQSVTGGDCGNVVTLPGVGTFTLANGQVTFVAVKGFVGIARASFVISDAYGQKSTSPIEVTVTRRQPVSVTIGGFAPGSFVLTAAIKSKVKAFLWAHKDYQVLECTGVTMGPTVLSVDKALSLNRARVGCAYALGIESHLKSKPLLSAQETTLGGHIRRIVLTLSDN